MNERDLVVVNGPIASGKSTVARALAALAEDRGIRAAVIDLDEVWHMIDHRSPQRGGLEDWLLARRAAAALTDVFFSAGVRTVIVEGPFFTPEERDGYLRGLQTQVLPTFVTLEVSLDESVRRATADPDPRRITSRDPTWLAERYTASTALFEPIRRTDLIISTDAKSSDAVAHEIADSLWGVSD